MASQSILIVEDEPFIVDALTFLFEREGYSVSSFSDGLGCFDFIASSKPDLVVLDMMLPNISGMDILEDIRSTAELALMPVLVLTAKGQRKDRLAAEDAGASLFMTKPFANQEIIENVKMLLKQ